MGWIVHLLLKCQLSVNLALEYVFSIHVDSPPAFVACSTEIFWFLFVCTEESLQTMLVFIHVLIQLSIAIRLIMKSSIGAVARICWSSYHFWVWPV